MRQRLNVRHRDSSHVIGERRLDPARLDPEPKARRIAVEWESGDSLDQLYTAELFLGERDPIRSRRPDEEKVVERPGLDRYKRHGLATTREPHMCVSGACQAR